MGKGFEWVKKRKEKWAAIVKNNKKSEEIPDASMKKKKRYSLAEYNLK